MSASHPFDHHPGNAARGTSWRLGAAALLFSFSAHLHLTASVFEVGHNPHGSEIPGLTLGDFPAVEGSDGSLSYLVPIEVPAARGGKVTPQLSLVYNSNLRDGWIGHGWALPMTWIESETMRRTPDRLDALDAAGQFLDARYVFTHQLGRKRLAHLGSGIYRARVEEQYRRFTFDGTNWQAVDGEGTVWRFNMRRVDERGQTVQWLLSEAADTNGNRCQYFYRDCAGNLAVTQSRYPLFPYLVMWNFYRPSTFLSTEYARNSVVLAFEQRPDPIHIAEFGTLGILGQRLSAMEVRSRDEAGSERIWRSYAFSYSQNPRNQRSRLAQVQAGGFGIGAAQIASAPADAVLPPTRFSYTDGSTAFPASSTSVTSPSVSLPDNMGYHIQPTFADAAMLDINGDGRDDYVRSVYTGGTVATDGNVVNPVSDDNWTWLANKGGDPGRAADVPFDNSAAWSSRGTLGQVALRGLTNVIDLNGDGRRDLVLARPYDPRHPSDGWMVPSSPGVWKVQFNTGSSFDTVQRDWSVQGVIDFLSSHGIQLPGAGSFLPFSWLREFAEHTIESDDHQGLRRYDYIGLVRDLTGDGIPDYIYSDVPGTTEWYVFPGYVDNTVSTPRGGFCRTPIVWGGLAFEESAQETMYWAHIERDRGDASAWPPISLGRSSGCTYTDCMLVDLNGDGLLDFIPSPFRKDPATSRTTVFNPTVYLNHGRGFAPATWGLSPNHAYYGDWIFFSVTRRSAPGDAGTPSIRQSRGLLDLNGDGLPDLLTTDGAGTALRVAYGTPYGFTDWTQPWLDSVSGNGTNAAFVALWVPDPLHGGAWKQVRGFADLNGDGLRDYVLVNGNGRWSTWLNPGSLSGARLPDLVRSVRNGIGGAAQFDFAPSTSFPDVRLPGVRYVLSSRVPSRGNTVLTPEDAAIELKYRSGALHQRSSDQLYEFRGFSQIDRTQGAGPWTRTLYEVGYETLAGKVNTIEKRSSANAVFERSSTIWAGHPVAGGITIPYRSRDDQAYLDGAASRTRRGEILQLDSFGNVLRRVDQGDLAISGDELYTTVAYAASSSSSVASLPSRITLASNSTGTLKLGETIYRYDGTPGDETSALSEGAVSVGNLKIVTQRIHDLNTTLLLATADTHRFSYDAFGNRISETRMLDATNGNRRSISFDLPFRLFPVHTVEGNNVNGGSRASSPIVTYLTWDAARGFLTARRDANNATTRYTPDSFNHAVREEITRGGQFVTARETQISYLSNGLLFLRRETQGPGQSIERFESYDGLGRLSKRWTRLGADHGFQDLVEAEVEYDDLGRESVIREPGRAISINRMARYCYYDEEGGLCAMVRTPYLAQGLAPSIDWHTDVAADTFVTRIQRSVATTGRIEDVFDANNDPRQSGARFRRRILDAAGRVREARDEEGNAVVYSYDRLGNLSQAQRTLRPNGFGVVTNVSVLTRIICDSLGRKISIQDPDKGTLRYQYDFCGNPLRIETADVDAPTNPLTALVYEYDLLGRLTRKRGERKQSGAWIADAAVDARFQYDIPADARFQLTPVVLIGAPLTGSTLTYTTSHPFPANLVGRLVSMSDPTGTTYFGYDEQGNPARLGKQVPLPAGPAFYSVERAYGYLGRLESTRAGGGDAVNYRYDSAGWLKSVDSLVPSLIAGQPSTLINYYNAQVRGELGLPENVLRGGRLVPQMFRENFAYDLRTRLLASQAAVHPTNLAAAPFLSQVLDSYDGEGHLLHLYDQRAQVDHWYEYDGAYRLADAEAAPRTAAGQRFHYTYQYDSLGNLRRETDVQRNRVSKEFFYRDSGLQPHAALSANLGGQYIDIDYQLGNIIGITQGTAPAGTGSAPPSGPSSGQPTVGGGLVVAINNYGARTFTYSTDSSLLSHNWQGGGSSISSSQSSYAYDGAGRRVQQGASSLLAASRRVYYIADELDITIENNGAGPVSVNQHIQALGRRLLTLSRATGSLVVNETHYIQDFKGNVRVTLNRWGNEASRSEYLPFGKLDGAASTGAVRFGHTGEELDMTGSLYYHRARYYDADLCRFITPDGMVPDPARPIGFNRYAYAYNNPICFIDPSGHEPISLAAVLTAAAVGAVVGGVSGYIAADQAGEDPLLGMLIGAGIGALTGAISEGFGSLVEAAILAETGSAAAGTIFGGAVEGALLGAGQALGAGAAAGKIDPASIQQAAALGFVQGGFAGGRAALAGKAGAGGNIAGVFLKAYEGGITSIINGENLGAGFFGGLASGISSQSGKALAGQFKSLGAGFSESLGRAAAGSSGAGDPLAAAFRNLHLDPNETALGAFGLAVSGGYSLAEKFESGSH